MIWRIMGFGVTWNGGRVSWWGKGRELFQEVLNSRSVGRIPTFGTRPLFSTLGFSSLVAQQPRQHAPTRRPAPQARLGVARPAGRK